jgi:outer membrane lipoprotein SlyB
VRFSLFFMLVLTSCASSPNLYPNPKYQQVGKEAAEGDVKACENQADQFVSNHTAENGAIGAGIGAAGGAVLGAITGSPGTGAAVGAVAGGGAGGASSASSTTDQKHRFVNRCLAERGYEVVGWS